MRRYSDFTGCHSGRTKAKMISLVFTAALFLTPSTIVPCSGTSSAAVSKLREQIVVLKEEREFWRVTASEQFENAQTWKRRTEISQTELKGCEKKLQGREICPPPPVIEKPDNTLWIGLGFAGGVVVSTVLTILVLGATQ